MPEIGGAFVSRKSKEQPFEVEWTVVETTKATRVYSSTVWAENLDDCEALAENSYQDGRISEGEPGVNVSEIAIEFSRQLSRVTFSRGG